MQAELSGINGKRIGELYKQIRERRSRPPNFFHPPSAASHGAIVVFTDEARASAFCVATATSQASVACGSRVGRSG
jgi:hypothetical protein